MKTEKLTLTDSQISFLQYCVDVKVTSGLEKLQFEDAKKRGYSEEGEMRKSFNRLRDEYLSVYNVVKHIR